MVTGDPGADPNSSGRLRTWVGPRRGFGHVRSRGPENRDDADSRDSSRTRVRRPRVLRPATAAEPEVGPDGLHPGVPIRPPVPAGEAPVAPSSPFLSMREMVGTTPGRLLVITAVLVMAAVVIGAYGSNVMTRRTTALSTIITDTEPIAQSAQVLYSSLSIADASANAAFISGGLESPELRSRYNDAIATASQALIQAASGTTIENQQVRSDLDTLSMQLPVYTGLIETARTNNRQGNPVGSSYLGMASNLMQSTILPAAERLYEKRWDAITRPDGTISQPPWGAYVLLTLLVVMLVATHVYVARHTRRRFNVGILVAIVCVALVFIWVLIGGLASVSAAHRATTDGLTPLRDLTEARILIQKGRSDETLSLARHGDEDTLESDFVSSADHVTVILQRYQQPGSPDIGDSVDSASRALAQWRSSHALAGSRASTGDFASAVRLTVGSGADGSSQAYATLDRALVEAIDHTRTTFRDDINTARVLIGYTGAGVVTLTVLAAIATAIGMFPRIREYR
ncbi:protein kinase G-activating protein GlnX [Gordonia jinhuaensis]|uniref:Secreted protein n=1 Tax=Gordonia jinhuaensis TaxID=1517702 RepID=A0A916TG79_9ACTN|nr:hypothetical protein GCM10011489_31840 [Gordonia jinhuaensis]